MRVPMMAGNWKMNCDNDEAWDLAATLAEELEGLTGCSVVVCPPSTALSTVKEALEGSEIALGAQNVYWEDSGAFTGEVGHSERRGRFGEPPEDDERLLKVFGDNDATVNRKAKVALVHGLTPIVCVGELLSERQAGQTDEIVAAQVQAALADLGEEEIERVVLAYEPVWAIGTGEVCDAEEANRVLGIIRGLLAEAVGDEIAQGMLILYGGSVKPDNVRGLMAQPEIDGGLVGGASLKAESFCELVRVAAEVKGR